MWSGIKSLLAALPVTFLAYLKHKFDGAPPESQSVLQAQFGGHMGILLLMGTPILLSLVFDFYEWAGAWLRERQANYVPEVALTKTIAALNSVVGQKLTRFADVAKRLSGQPEPIQAVFREITLPEKQIEELVEQIWTLLASLTENVHLKVVLVGIDKGKPAYFAGYSPASKRPSDELLDPDQTFFSYVANTRSFQVVDDIAGYVAKREKCKPAKERERRYPVRFLLVPGQENTGSICGFPVFHAHLNEVTYVLTIKADEPKQITGKFKKAYGPVLEHFFARILLEHSLKVIRNHAN